MNRLLKKTGLLVLAATLSLMLISGCGTAGQTDTQEQTTQAKQETTTQAQQETTTSQGDDDSDTEQTGQDAQGDDQEEETGMFQIAGSDTEVNMVQRLTEVYTGTQSGVQFAVTGGGSGTGIAALIDNQIDVANSSRPMRDSEIEQAIANGVEPVAFIFAQDGLAVIVNENNAIEELTVDQIGAIFRGDITNWNEVGGDDMDISTYGRQSSSGTYVYFMESVVKGDYSSGKKMLAGNANIVEGVLADQASIGYVGIGYAAQDGAPVSGLKILNVAADENSEAATPLEIENIMQGKYPIVRPLFHYTNGTPQGALKEYLAFVVSDEGQAIVQQEGFFPITAEYQAMNDESFGS